MPRTIFSAASVLNLQNTSASAGLTDLLVHEVEGQAFLYATTLAGGQVSALSLGSSTGQASLQSTTALSPAYSQMVDINLAVRDVGGNPQLLLSGLSSDPLRGFTLDTTGAGIGGIEGALSLGTTGFDASDIRAIAVAESGDFGLAGLQAGGVVQLQFSGSSVSSTQLIAPAQGGGGDVSDIFLFTHGDVTFAAAASGEGNQVHLLRSDGGPFTYESSVSVGDGVWFNNPGAMSAVTVDGTSYLVVAGQGSNSLTMFQVDAVSNELTPVDHILDTLATRFAAPSHLEAFESAGRSFVAAAGDDAGLTIFEVLPGGSLHIVSTLVGSVASPLDGITALEVLDTGNGVRLFVATEAEPFLVEYDFAFSDLGVQLTAASGGGALNGGQSDDSLIGQAGNDALYGHAGADVLVDGDGVDSLWGGSGADTFVLVRDGERDRIMDFEVGVDVLDVSALSQMFSPDNIGVSFTGYGADLFIGGEVIELHAAGGGAIQLSDLGWGAFVDVDRVYIEPEMPAQSGGGSHPSRPDAPDVVMSSEAPVFPEISGSQQSSQGSSQQGHVTLGSGNDIVVLGSEDNSLNAGGGNDQVDAGWGDDFIDGSSGNDVIFGGVGFDIIRGGSGNDQIDGGAQADQISGGFGDDLIVGGEGFNSLSGDGGNDQIWGGSSPDRLYGGDGDDILWGGASLPWTVDGLFGGDGNDIIHGESGFDLLEGGAGDDLLFGGSQADNLLGEAGVDWLDGGHGFDRLFGGDGNDVLLGGQGTDALFGQTGDDVLAGGSENDRLWGGIGNDVLWGDEGNDALAGGAGFDWIDGGAGDDSLAGNFNADTFAFSDGHGHDIISDFDAQNDLERINLSLLSELNNFDAVMAASQQVGADVLIETGDNSTITLLGVQLTDLDAVDFVF